ncbi:MAG TPA: hypothetical protein VNA69_22965 [Thermoanaerobaculia bacterium]|nr:hypothetical protein [Thermoanaerobaculia bacterium]
MKRCSYVVLIESGNALRELARYLSDLGVTGCEVVILDPSPRVQFELHARTLRWVGRHVRVRPDHRAAGGAVDIVRAAAAVASCEKIVVATDDVRYAPEAIFRICSLLDIHEIVEPQDYLDPLPWWGGIDAGRILVHRGIEPRPDHGATFGFRRGVVRALRTLTTSEAASDQVRRLASHGAAVHPAHDVFVRRQPRLFADWLAHRPRLAAEEFELPFRTAFFLALLPLLALLATLGGATLASSCAGVIAFASVALALRGRIGAASFFPLRACLFAPLWLLERSVAVYWALLRKVRGVGAETERVAAPERADDQVASGRR